MAVGTKGVLVRPSKTPPNPEVLRRRGVIAEAGLEHRDIRTYLLEATGAECSRQAVTGVINGRFTSAEFWIERGIVEACRQSFVALGKEGRAKQVTLEYLGWTVPASAPKVNTKASLAA